MRSLVADTFSIDRGMASGSREVTVGNASWRRDESPLDVQKVGHRVKKEWTAAESKKYGRGPERPVGGEVVVEMAMAGVGRIKNP